MAIYNNQALGQGFSALAQAFAPPSATEMAGYSTAALNQQKRDQLAQLFGSGKTPSEQAALVGIQNYGQTPAGFTYQVDQNNSTLRANNLQDNRYSVIRDRYTTPISQGQKLPELGADIAGQFSLPAMPEVQGNPKPLSETEVKGGWLQQLFGQDNLIKPDDVARQYKSDTKIVEVIGPDGKTPMYVSQDVAPGMTPAPKAPLVSMGSESAYDKVLGESMAKTEVGINKAASDAQAQLNTIAAMRGLMTDPNFYSGPGAEQVRQIKALGASLGFTVPDAAKPAEAFAALGNQYILDAAGGSFGNQISNGDVAIIRGTKPNLDYTEAGNALLMDLLEKRAQRSIDVVGWAQEYKATHGGRLDGGWATFLKEKAEANPLFPQSQNAPNQGGADSAGGEVFATNPATGQRLVLRNGQWVPVE